MYLLDTNVISEIRKKSKANRGVQLFFSQAETKQTALYMSVISVGELRRGVELIRHRGDITQAVQLENWLDFIISEYRENILRFTEIEAQIWGRLRVPHHENPIDKQIAATALTYDLTLVSRNIADFTGLGIALLNPFD